MLMVMIPGADLRIRNNHGKKIEAQQVGVGHGEVQDKVQRTECEDTCHRKSIFGMLECFELKSHFPCAQNPFACNFGTRVWNLPAGTNRCQRFARLRTSD